MKLLTLNTHSLAEQDYESKLYAFAQGVLKERPDVIALQEVNQSQAAPPADPHLLTACGYIPCGGSGGGEESEPSRADNRSQFPGPSPMAGSSQDTEPSPDAMPVLRTDNHAFRLGQILAESGFSCQWTWTAAKTGYGRYDEGLAVFSRLPILDTQQFYITGTRDYSNWKTRNILGVRISAESGTEYVYSVHMGWWDDPEEPFKDQWQRICQGLTHTGTAPVWLMGDFNSPAHVKGEGRDLILHSGWLDSYDMAARKDDGITVSHAIDGWKERGGTPGMRIDYIWTNHPKPVISTRTIFNGAHYPVVSDHFGIIIEY